MKRVVLTWLSALLAVGGVAADTVDVSKYDAFWLWACERRRFKTPRVVFMSYRGRSKQSAAMSRRCVCNQGVAVPHDQPVEVWLAYRVHTLHWTRREYAILLAQLQRWRQAGNKVVGVQIDFDARTLHLEEYVEFLEGLRRQLPSDCRLGITGLLDWSRPR